VATRRQDDSARLPAPRGQACRCHSGRAIGSHAI
jgi:hypothetical protein